jgi:hypothetical protein
VYSRAPGAEACPDEDALRHEVASRVGYDPFFAWANETIVASMSHDETGGFVARVALVDDRGTQHGTRDIRTQNTCDELLASARGQFTVIDASATLGPGEYQVRFTADTGAVSLAQVLVLSAPSKIRFFVPTVADYVPPQTWKFRAGVCGPNFGPQDTCANSNDLLSAMQGRWIWCAGTPDGVFDGVVFDGGRNFPQVGFDIRSDGTWTTLEVGRDGSLVPSALSGSLQLSGGNAFWAQPSSPTLINPSLPAVDQCHRAMLPWPHRVCDCTNPGSTTCHADPCPIDVADSQLFVRMP